MHNLFWFILPHSREAKFDINKLPTNICKAYFCEKVFRHDEKSVLGLRLQNFAAFTKLSPSGAKETKKKCRNYSQQSYKAL